MVTPSRCFLLENCPMYYPFGNTRARNVLENFKFKEDSVGEDSLIKILFLGCGDLRNMLLTTASSPSSNLLDIHLNEINPSVVARNILILQIISDKDFDIDGEEDIAFLWDLWYNAEWPESSRKKFRVALKNLLDGVLSENVTVSLSNSSSQSLNEVWNAWYSTSSKIESESHMLMKEIHNQRAVFMRERWGRVNNKGASQKGESSFSAVVDLITMYYISKNIVKENLNESEYQKLLEEVKTYFATGTCRQQKENTFACVNPTLLNPMTHRWHVHHTLNPFDSYLPLSPEELDSSVGYGRVVRSCQNVLRRLVASYRSRAEKIKVFVHLEDALEFCYSENMDKFDVIDTSNLADHVGLANIINACSKRLVDLPEAMLFTESMSWKGLATSLLQYVEETLCSPLSMIPTIYGMRLADHVELGASAPVNLNRVMLVPTVNLCWKKVPVYHNIVLHSSLVLVRCLSRLASECFTLPYPNKKMTSKEQCGMISYSPLTFNYVVDSIIQRTGGNPASAEWLKSARQANIPEVFNLAQQTADAWKDGRTVLKLTAFIEMKTPDQTELITAFKMSQSGAPALRLILTSQTSILTGSASLNTGLYDSSTQFIDNLHLEVKMTTNDEIGEVSFSFLLVPDHGLEETHVGFIVDVSTNRPIFLIESLKSLRAEKFCLTYPFPPKATPQAPSKCEMVVDSCVELEDQYIIKVMIKCGAHISPSGLKVSTNQRKPCESAHNIILSLNQPKNTRPMIVMLSLSHPFLVESIRAVLHRSDRVINLVLMKALLEPWPCEFQAASLKRSLDCLKPWVEGKMDGNTLAYHLGSQFNLFPEASQLKSVILDEVRELIKSVFVNATIKHQHDFVISIQQKGAPRPDWYLRFHRPLRISSVGNPVLVLSALDQTLAEDLITQGKLDEDENTTNFHRICTKHITGPCLILWTTDPKVVKLWRFVLRLNSTKFQPSSWQKSNLPLGENNPWLATFISPLYAGSLGKEMDMEKLTLPCEMPTAKVGQPNRCAKCKKTSPSSKRCSRCRVIFYCGVECQRKHWPQHKNACIPPK